MSGPGDKFEGPGAHGGGILPVIARGENRRGQIGQKLAVGLSQGDGDAPAVRRLHVLNIGKRLHLKNAVAAIFAAGQGLAHVLRRHGVAVVELDPVPDGKGIGQLVVGNFILFRHGGDQIPLRGGLHQPLEYVEHDLLGPCRHRFVGVKALVQVLGDAHGNLVRPSFRRLRRRFVGAAFVLRRLGRAAVFASAEYGAQKPQQEENLQKFPLHVCFLSSLPVPGSALDGECPARTK